MSERTSINPWSWSTAVGFDQGIVVEGAHRTVYLSGQAAMSPEGEPQHAGDMAAQLELVMDNLEAVLATAGMTLANLVRLNTFTTDPDAFFADYSVMADRIAAAGVRPTSTFLVVSRLAFPELLVELEGTAVD